MDSFYGPPVIIYENSQVHMDIFYASLEFLSDDSTTIYEILPDYMTEISHKIFSTVENFLDLDLTRSFISITNKFDYRTEEIHDEYILALNLFVNPPDDEKYLYRIPISYLRVSDISEILNNILLNFHICDRGPDPIRTSVNVPQDIYDDADKFRNWLLTMITTVYHGYHYNIKSLLEDKYLYQLDYYTYPNMNNYYFSLVMRRSREGIYKIHNDKYTEVSDELYNISGSDDGSHSDLHKFWIYYYFMVHFYRAFTIKEMNINMDRGNNSLSPEDFPKSFGG